MSADVPLLRDLLGRDHASSPEVWAARVARAPDAPFLRWEGRVWSYADAWLEIRRFAGFLRGIGVAGGGGRPTDGRAASYLTNCPEAIWTWYGTHAAGLVYVPLNRHHQGDLLADMLARSKAKVLVTEPSALATLPPLRSVGVQHLVVTGDEPLPEPHASRAAAGMNVTRYDAAATAEPFLAGGVRFDDIATIMFTSGTTGRSKAARLPHNMLCRGAARIAERFGFTERDVFHGWMPLYHIGGKLHTVSSMLAAGGSVALYPTFSRSRFWSQVEESGATAAGLMPNVMRMLWDLPPRPGGDRSTLRIAVVGILPATLHQPFEERFGIRLCDCYGMTEMEPITLPELDCPAPVGSCGRVAPDFEMRIVGPDGDPCPPGVTGEIVARPRAPALMMRGYEDDDAATVEQWRDLWWHTGDLGRVDERGFLYYEGRIKQMIRKGGENISVYELEEAVKRHPGVADAVAVGVPSPLGEEDVKLVVVPEQGSEVSPEKLHAWSRERLAKFMVPRYIEIREALPFSFIGKVDRDALKAGSEATWDAERARAGG